MESSQMRIGRDVWFYDINFNHGIFLGKIAAVRKNLVSVKRGEKFHILPFDWVDYDYKPIVQKVVFNELLGDIDLKKIRMAISEIIEEEHLKDLMP